MHCERSTINTLTVLALFNTAFTEHHFRKNPAVIKFKYPRVSPGDQPLANEPEDSGYEIGPLHEKRINSQWSSRRNYLPIHSLNEHFTFSVGDPVHFVPLLDGGGLMQVLVLVFKHFSLQRPQFPHKDQPPLTEKKEGKSYAIHTYNVQINDRCIFLVTD